MIASVISLEEGMARTNDLENLALKKSIAMYISYSFLSFLGICDTVKPKYAVEIHHQHIHIHIKDSVVQRFNVHLKITVKTDTCTLCPILFSGTLTAELPLTAGGLQCGAVLCFLINNSECI